jgi:hypothetical protein
VADVVGELEAAITAAGTLLVWAEKYRHADPNALPSSRRRLLELADRARRLARTGALGGTTASDVLRDVHEANQGLRGGIDAVRSSATYRGAVDAYASGNAVVLLDLLPRIFADLRAAPPPAAAFWTPTWQHRGRPLPVERVVEDLVGIREDGIRAFGDDLVPGVDPALPAILMSIDPHSGVPLAIRYDGAVLPTPCLYLGDDQLVFPVERLRLPFTVVLAAPGEPLDEWLADGPAYLEALAVACRHAALPLAEKPTPAASS